MTFNLDLSDRVTSMATGSEISSELSLEGRQIHLTNLDRVLYPETGFTKRDLIDYYAVVAPVLLPHLRNRPLSMRRFPEGVRGEGFWEKNCPDHRPDWVETASVKSESSARGRVRYCLVNDLATLVWVANLACIELHVSLAGATRRKTPDFMVFDLDPGEPAGIIECAEIALLVRDTLRGQNLDSFPKVSGSKGIQVYVPLNRRGVRYERTSEFAHALAETFAEAMPNQVVSKMRKSLRPGKVLIDWSQNSRHKTTVAVYSLRATPRPSCSAPISWERLEQACENSDSSFLRFQPEEMISLTRVEGDRFASVLSEIQRMPG